MATPKRNKKVSGKHSKPRRAVQIPEEWAVVAEDLAGDERMPLAWWLIDVIKAKAEAAGKLSLPPVPWKKSSDEEDE